jgi:hypothetical protein
MYACAASWKVIATRTGSIHVDARYRVRAPPRLLLRCDCDQCGCEKHGSECNSDRNPNCPVAQVSELTVVDGGRGFSSFRTRVNGTRCTTRYGKWALTFKRRRIRLLNHTRFPRLGPKDCRIDINRNARAFEPHKYVGKFVDAETFDVQHSLQVVSGQAALLLSHLQ